ncbi:MAG: hypothetical protein NAOJABEB_02975 [Steroidobacteraceae bacterium]|nr:hypothetical protein [Steroidobacteraceae bacterium]
MHDAAMNYVVETLTALKFQNGGKAVCELGSCDVNGSVRPLFAGVAMYVGVDRRGGRGVDVVADGADYGEPEAFDLVISTETLEHAPNAAAVVANAARILKRGGHFVMTAAGEGRAPHGNDGGDVSGEYYANIHRDDLADWLAASFGEHYAIVENPNAGDIYARATKR